MSAIPELGAAFVPFTPTERQSFFDAIAAHRSAAWRVTATSAVCAVLFSYVIAVLLAPLTWAAVLLGLDLINFVIATPSLGTAIIDAVDFDSRTDNSIRALASLSFVAALPGLAVLGVALLGVRRVLAQSALFADGDDLPGRRPDGTRLAEQRFANVVTEMALAASLAPPRVLITSVDTFNAAAFGRDESHATIVVSERLLEGMTRAQMQGLAGHLVSSIADGDMVIGTRVATVLCFFGVMGRLSSAIHDPQFAWKLIPSLVLAGCGRRRDLADRVVMELADPLKNNGSAARAGRDPTKFELAMMPLTAPLSIVGFLGIFLCQLVVAPLLAVAWRQRKYMADAAAVRLTRDPDAVADALRTIARERSDPFSPLVTHLSVVDAGTIGNKGILASAWVAMFPSMVKRLKALARLGATVEIPVAPALEGTRKLLIIALAAIVVPLLLLAVVLLTGICVAIGMLFTGLPVGLVHMILRWLAG